MESPKRKARYLASAIPHRSHYNNNNYYYTQQNPAHPGANFGYGDKGLNPADCTKHHSDE